jgi:hypothetical protein
MFEPQYVLPLPIIRDCFHQNEKLCQVKQTKKVPSLVFSFHLPEGYWNTSQSQSHRVSSVSPKERQIS